MADEEKTEEATDKKIQDARLEGNVPKSQEVGAFITLLIAFVLVFAMSKFIVSQIVILYKYYHALMGQEFTIELIVNVALKSLFHLVLMIMPIAVSVAIGGVIASLIQFGFIFTTKPIMPNLGKINPLKGLKNLFSLKKAIEGLKIILKVSVVFAATFYFILKYTKESSATIFYDLFSQLKWLEERIIVLVAIMFALFLVITAIDVFIVRFNYFKDLRMSKQEIKDEFKQMEGDPQIKGRIRRMQMEMSQKRMMHNIPDADVVITNPTHYAVALRYDKEKEKAPVVLAKGVDRTALKIREIALNNGVQIVQNPPLARELYKSCELDQMIPESLYKAVAEVLAFVYQSEQKNQRSR